MHSKMQHGSSARLFTEDFSVLLRKALQDGCKLKLDKMNPEKRYSFLAGRKGIIYQGMW